MKFSRISDSSIIAKLLGINLLILLAVALIAGMNLFSSRQVENTLVPLINSDVKQIIQNSALARELNTGIAELNLLLTTFTAHPELLDTKGKDLLNKIKTLMIFPNQADTVTESLTIFHDALKRIFDKCQNVGHILLSIDSSDKSLEEQLSILDNMAAELLIERKSSGKEYSVFSIEQVIDTVPDIRNMLLHVKLYLNEEVTSSHLYTNFHKYGDEQTVFITLQNVSSNLQSVITAGKEFKSIGILLITAVQEYRKQIRDYHDALIAFQDEYKKLKEAQFRVMTVLKDIDNKINNSTGQIQENISNNLKSSRNLTMGLSIGILIIVIFAIFFAFRMIHPLSDLAKISAQLAKGNINCKINEPRSNDEIGILFRVFKQLIDATHETTKAAEEIADGNLTVQVRERSEYDRMMQALNRMVQKLSDIMNETDSMIQAVGMGQLNIRGNADAFEGGWRELITGVNHLIEGLSGAVSRSAALAQEMELARKIQTSLLPTLTENIHPDFEIAAFMLPAEQVGGDFYDVTTDRSGHLWLAIGDVSGHGVTPGLIMMMAQTVHTTVTTNLDCDAKSVVVKINEILYMNVRERLKESHFMTFIALKYMENGRFQHAGAHLSMIIFRKKTGACELVRTRGIYLNFKRDISKATKNSEFSLESGDILVLYTDGLTEAHDPEGNMLDLDGFVKIVESHAHQEPEEMKDMIMADVINWCDNIRTDDMTLVIVKRKEVL